jgi:hypothetical protein
LQAPFALTSARWRVLTVESMPVDRPRRAITRYDLDDLELPRPYELGLVSRLVDATASSDSWRR